jgi:RNA polymerase sigma factor (sigma-70 family)
VPYRGARMDDSALVERAREGSKDAFAAIYDRYADRLFDFVSSVLHDRDEAADVVQDTFLVAGARLHQLREPAKLRPWLYAIARHEALRRTRRRQREEPVEELEVTATAAEPPDAAHRQELAELVAAAAAGLNPRDRVVLELHLRHGLEGEELGDAIGVSAGHAYVLLSRLRDQVERSLGALLVARLGQRDCEELAALLSGWDGGFSPLVRKRVARHVDACEICRERRGRLASPLALLSALPPLTAPTVLRDRVLDDVKLASHQSRPWPARRDGFPPAMGVPSRRRIGAAAAVVAVVGLVVAAVLVGTDGRQSVEVETAGRGQQAAAPSEHPTTTVAPPGAPSPAVPDTARSLAPPSGEPAPTSGATSGSPAGGGSGSASPEPGGGDSGDDGSGSLSGGEEPPRPIDRTGPTLASLAVTPTTVWEAHAGGTCGTSARPTAATVTVSASDPSGVVSVTLEPPSVTMSPTGAGTYKAVLGPFPQDTAPRGGSVSVLVRVSAQDSRGNVSAITGTLIVRDCRS